MLVEDERSGRPSTSKTTEYVEKIRELIHEAGPCLPFVFTLVSYFLILKMETI
jgi:hypothetical protein